jgi:hypothetical protein
MAKSLKLVVLLGLLSLAALMAQQFPLWEQLLQHYGGKTDDTPVPSMKMGNHMQMSLQGKPQAAINRAPSGSSLPLVA